MNGMILNGREIFVGFAKHEMFIRCEDKANSFDHSSNFPSIINLSVNQGLFENSILAALVIDRTPIKQLKLFKWLRSRNISIIISVKSWGLYGYIVQCKDEDSFNRLTMGPNMNELEFLSVQPMTQRRNIYSRVTRLMLNGIPFEYCSPECMIEVVKIFGNVLFIESNSQNLKQADSLFVLAEVNDPGPIHKYVSANISNNTTCKVWVEEANFPDTVEVVSDESTNEYNSLILLTRKALEVQIDSPLNNSVSPVLLQPSSVNHPEEGEIVVGDAVMISPTPTNVDKTKDLHLSMERVQKAILSHKKKKLKRSK